MGPYQGDAVRIMLRGVKCKMSFKKSTMLPVFFLLLVAFSPLHAENTLLSRTQVLMGTYCMISLEESRSAEIEKGFDHLKKLEGILSSYQKDASVYRLNRDKEVAFDPMLSKILQLSKTYYRQTEGYFDITIGSITKKLYRFGEEEQIPTEREKAQAATGIEHITIDADTIRLGEGITIDLGGIGKGFAVDELSCYYASMGITEGEIALSGDIRCLGRCRVEIQDPFAEERTMATLYAKAPNLSVSTSGTYRRFVKEKKEHHLIDPKRKTQGRAFVSVTIVAYDDNTLCDAMATAISVMPLDTALEFVRSQSRFGYLLVTSDGKVISGNLHLFVEIEGKMLQ